MKRECLVHENDVSSSKIHPDKNIKQTYIGCTNMQFAKDKHMPSVSRKASLLEFMCYKGIWMNLGFNCFVFHEPTREALGLWVLLNLVQLSVSGTQKTGFSSSCTVSSKTYIVT